MDDYGHQTTTTGKTFAMLEPLLGASAEDNGKRKGCIRKSGLVREPSSKSFLQYLTFKTRRKGEGLSNSVPSVHLLRFVTLGEASPPLL
jgi:hypothetical protein